MKKKTWDTILYIAIASTVVTYLAMLYLDKKGIVGEKHIGYMGVAFFISAPFLAFLYCLFTKTLAGIPVLIERDKHPFMYWFMTLFYLFVSLFFLVFFMTGERYQGWSTMIEGLWTVEYRTMVNINGPA